MFFIGKIKRDKRIRIVSTGAFSLLVILGILAVFPVVNHKEEAEATVVPATTTLSIVSSKDTAAVDITPTSSTGTFATSSAADQAEFTVTTDNLTGYSVTLLGTDTSGQLVNAASGDTLDTIASDTTESDFINGSAATYANKWGYRLNVNGTTTTDFMAAPTTNTAKTIHTTTSPNTSTPDNYKLSLGARVDYTKASGTYTNTFVLTAVGNPVAYTVNYLDDSPDSASVTGLPSPDAGTNTISNIMIPTATPSRATYKFNRWCDGIVTHSTGGDTCSGTTYTAGANYVPTPNGTNNLYAMWSPVSFEQAFAAAGATKVTYNGTARYTMQSMTTNICAAVTNDQYLALLDNRIVSHSDAATRHVYGVRKINGNCWMVRDLVFGNGTYNGNSITLKASESNVPSDRTISFYNLGTDTSHCVTPATGAIGSANACIVAGQDGNGTSIMYYTYTAASAGYVAGSTNATADSANYSLCPKGWRLPSLAQAQSLQNHRDEFNVGYGGYFGSSRAAAQVGVTSYWWGSEAQSGGSSADRLYMVTVKDTDTTIRSNYYTRSIGYTIRCVAK